VLFLALGLLFGVATVYGKIGPGTEFFPETDPERAVVDIRAPQGTNIHETDRIARLVEQRLEPYSPWLEHVITNVGSAGGTMNLTASVGGSHMANVTLVFYDFAERERPSREIIAEVREALADISGVEIKVESEEGGPPTGAPVTVRIIGEDFQTLEQLSAEAQRLIAAVPNVVNLRSDHEGTRPELAFTVDRRVAMLLGVNTATVGNFLVCPWPTASTSTISTGCASPTMPGTPCRSAPWASSSIREDSERLTASTRSVSSP